MKRMMPALHSAALLLLLLLPGTLTANQDPGLIQVEVQNSRNPPLNYKTTVAYRGILLGALKRLMDSNSDFKFSYTENPDYGPYLESVNGVAGNNKDHTYWELLVQSPDGHITRPDVGIGCYIPSAGEKIILRFTTWSRVGN